MNDENQRRIRDLVTEAFGYMVRASGFRNNEEGMAAIREQFRDPATSPAAWIHKQAEAIYPGCAGNTIKPEQFFDILGFIGTEEKLTSLLTSGPDEYFPRIEAFLLWLVKEYLPSMRTQAQTAAKELPQFRRGGPKVQMPDASVRREIYEEIMREYGRTGSMTEAQTHVARKRKLNVRMIQRIKAMVIAENQESSKQSE
jgi:hypothetical protein